MTTLSTHLQKITTGVWIHKDMFLPVFGIIAGILYVYPMWHGMSTPSAEELAEAGKNKCVKGTLLSYEGDAITNKVLEDAFKDCEKKAHLAEQKNKVEG